MKTAQTFDAETGAPTTASPTVPLTTGPSVMTAPSTTVNIPMKVVVPIVWIAIGFGVCWWITRPSRRSLRD
jgi:hypothetical protein